MYDKESTRKIRTRANIAEQVTQRHHVVSGTLAYQEMSYKRQNVGRAADPKGITVLSLKTAPGAFEIRKVTLLLGPPKKRPSYFMFMTFLLFSFLLSTVNECSTY